MISILNTTGESTRGNHIQEVLKFTLNVRNKKSLSKNFKVRATGGLRKQWELGVKSKVESSTPPPPH